MATTWTIYVCPTCGSFGTADPGAAFHQAVPGEHRIDAVEVVPKATADELAAGIESAMRCCWGAEEYPGETTAEQCPDHGPAAVALAKYREPSYATD